VLVVDRDAYFDPAPDPNADFARWLNERIDIPDQLARALGVRYGSFSKRYEAMYPLARALKFDTERLNRPAWSVLDAMLQPLGDALAVGSKSFVDDVESDLHTRVCRAATADLTLDTVDAAINEFRFGKVWLDRTQARDVSRELRAMLAKQLSVRLLKAMNDWRK